MRTITFNELRRIKDSFPTRCVGIHFEPGPDGGLVMLDNTVVLDCALKILNDMNSEIQNRNNKYYVK
ncbi:hypothetical protein EZS27_011556 [termite gut metagenome]|uniref:Uncharacterized protein n=1 Tax=termite gut metagenome TaxID=433724 RepID=A0A5J4RZ81_9ZZZZ